MAPTPWFRALLNRLAFFTKPVPLVSSVFLVVLTIFLFEYRSHPEWFGAFSQDATGPNEDIDLSGLTPDEQAAAADIDNLALLLNDLGVTNNGQTPSPDDQSADNSNVNAFLQDVLASSQGTTEGNDNANNPFDEYLKQYRFPGRGSQSTATPSVESTSSLFGSGNTSSSTDASAAFNPTAASASTNPLSALQQAMQEQGFAGFAGDRPLSLDTADTTPRRLTNGSEPTATGTLAGSDLSGTSGLSTQSSGLLGAPFAITPTVPTVGPQKSPPPGTTGYTPPASLGTLQTPTGRNSNSNLFPSAVGGSGLGVPSATPMTPNLNVPNIDVSAGTGTTPYAPIPSAVPSTGLTTTPSPFSVPRPPGSYTGGGYINTFSDPLGPPAQ